MSDSIDPDRYSRVAKLLVDAGDVQSFAEAAERLAHYRILIYADADACRSSPWQAALATAVNAGARAVHGGVLVELETDSQWLANDGQSGTLSAILASYGAQCVDHLPDGDPAIIFASNPRPGRHDYDMFALAGQWSAGVSPEPEDLGRPSVLGAVMSAAICVSERFQQLRGYPVAGDRREGVSLWSPEAAFDGPAARGPEISALPAEAWILGLGHLGQAYAWLLALLPYGQGDRHLVVQDDDRLSDANRATSLLEYNGALGRRKTRLVCTSLERAGWDVAMVERRYRGGSVYAVGEPGVLLAGVDNRQARRALDETGFPAIYDGGLGAGPDGYLDMAVRRLPAERRSVDIWPEHAVHDRTAQLLDSPAYQALAAESGDLCGVELLAGRTVATAFVGTVAACWVVAGVLRELHGGLRYELVDYSLRHPGTARVVPATHGRRLRIATLPVRVIDP